MRLAVVGAGYVGLVTAVCFADIGHEVRCVDIDENKVRMLIQGEVPIYEPDLKEYIVRNQSADRLSFTTQAAEAVALSEVVFIAVDTPPKPSGEADLSKVKAVAEMIADAIDDYILVVNISTVPIGTVERIGRLIAQKLSPSARFDIASNPEFLREGNAISDRLHPARIVIGAESERAFETLRKVYEPIDSPIIETNIRTAEMIKYASNAFLATKISFINEIAHICESIGADVKQVAYGMGFDKRIGFDFLNAGLGYGGSCFPKDTKALDHIALEQGHNFTLLKAVIDVNSMQRARMVQKVKRAVGHLDGRTIGILGLAFKPDTDDMREAASIDIISQLQSAGAHIKAYDPIAMNKAGLYLDNVEFCENAYEACRGSDALVIITEWDEFKGLDLQKVKSLMKQPIIMDGRNIFEPEDMRRLGFTYCGIGR